MSATPPDAHVFATHPDVGAHPVRQLVAVLQKQPYLIVLDGFERLLAAYPGQAKIWMSFGHALKTAGQQERAIAAFVRRKSRERASGLSGQLPGYGVKVGKDYVVISLSASGEHAYAPVHVDEFVGETGYASVTVNDKRYKITCNSRLNDVRIEGVCNGNPFVAQIERGTARNPLALVVQHNGTRIDALVAARDARALVLRLFTASVLRSPAAESRCRRL